MTRFRKSARRVSTLVERDIKRMGEKRGFSETRLLTHWAEIAGADTATICRPIKVGFPRGGFGAVLTLLTTGAQAPMLQMRLPQIIERVNQPHRHHSDRAHRLCRGASGIRAKAQTARSTQRTGPDPCARTGAGRGRRRIAPVP